VLLRIQQQMITEKEIVAWMKKNEITPFRAKQVMHAVFKEGKINFFEMRNLPGAVIEKLTKNINILCLSVEKIIKSSDSRTEKILFRLQDNNKIETVLMRFKDGRNSVCVSSQCGCRLGCKFCATGAFGFNRDLTAEEIADQALFCNSILWKEKKRISNIIYMGMGEPFLNYDNVLASLKLLNDKKLLNIGARSITISTSGICDGIEKLATEKLQVNLAISLHASNQSIREKIMPVAKIFPLNALMSAVKKYIAKTNRRVTYEYIMLNGINDRINHAKELTTLLKGQLCHINLIQYNETGLLGFNGSAKNNIKTFAEILRKSGLPVTIRVSMGQDINAACGQLANKV